MIKRTLVLTFLSAILHFSEASSNVLPVSARQKMKPEEIVAKHLQSLGSPEALDSARSRIITGTTTVTLRGGGYGQITGSARFVSQGNKSLISMIFGNIEYPYEKIGFDGTKLTVSQVKPGVRTIIGRYLLTNDELSKQGLVGGALATAWPLLNLSKSNIKLQYEGLKNVDNRQVHQLKCRPRNTDIGISLLFDPETFQHVGTQYKQTLSPPVGSNRPGETIGQDETRISITEAFSDFRAESGLNLPHRYQLKLEILASKSSMYYEWMIELTKFAFGEPISADEFNADSVKR